MTSDNVILVAGGDLRQQYAARRLRQKTGADVWTMGLPAQSGLHNAETLEEVPAYDVLVLPVPASPDGTTVPAPFGKAALPLETLAAHGKLVAVCGNYGIECAAALTGNVELYCNGSVRILGAGVFQHCFCLCKHLFKSHFLSFLSLHPAKIRRNLICFSSLL